jgi:hypothetical protein
MLLVLYRVFHWVVRTCPISRKYFVLRPTNLFKAIICSLSYEFNRIRRYAWFNFERLYFFWYTLYMQGISKKCTPFQIQISHNLKYCFICACLVIFLISCNLIGCSSGQLFTKSWPRSQSRYIQSCNWPS